MPRPIWVPTTDEQRQALAAIDEAVKEAAEAEGKLRQAIEAARGVGIPVRVVVEHTKASRSTLYRRLTDRRPGE